MHVLPLITIHILTSLADIFQNNQSLHLQDTSDLLKTLITMLDNKRKVSRDDTVGLNMLRVKICNMRSLNGSFQ